MANETWAVRVDEEVKQDIISLMNESGVSGQDFILNLISTYKLKKAEEAEPVASQDIKELQFHIIRIQDIYYNLTKRIESRLKEKDIETQDFITEKNDLLERAYERIRELEVELEESRKEAAETKKELVEQSRKVAELEDVAVTTKALVAEYRGKNDTLTGLLSEYKQYKTDIDQARQDLEAEKEARHKTEIEKDDTLKSVESIQEKHKAELEIIFERHQVALENIKNNLAIECKQAILTTKEKHQEEVNELHKTYNAKMQEIILVFNQKLAQP